MKFNIEEAIKFPLKDQDWPMKIGIFIGVTIVITFISSIGQFTPYFFTGSELEDSIALFTGLGMCGLSLFMIPFYIYLYGYVMETMRNVMRGEEKPLPIHGDVMTKLKLFGGAFVIGLTVMILSFIIIALMIPGFFLVASEGLLVAMGVLYLVFTGIIAFVVWIALAMIVVPAMLYIFLSTGSVGSAYDYTTLKKVIASSWKDLLIVQLISIALSLLLTFVTYASWLCLLGWLVGAVLQIWYMFTQAHLLGQVYRELEKEKILGK